jgi:hypothetical protein
MFEHKDFDVYSFDAIPLDRDCYLMDEMYIEEYEKFMFKVLSGSEYEPPIGYISYAAVRKINVESLEMSWYPNIYDRFHEVVIILPKADFVACVGSWRWSEKPHIFVKSQWLNNLHLRRYSAFGLIDAIDVKEAIRKGTLTRERLIQLRNEIDTLGKSYPQVSFISFADTILIKSNWSVGQVGSEVRYTYEPEIFITIVKRFREIFAKTLGLAIYAVLTQGSNEYYDDSLLHISELKNHVCLNSLGLPFAQLLAIDESVRSHLRAKVHSPSDLYMDAQFYRSLNFKFEFLKTEANSKYPYKDKMIGTDTFYYAAQLPEVLENLK